MLNVHRNHKAYYNISDWEKGEEGEGGIIYLSLHCHNEHDSCLKMGSHGSHFNVSLIVRGKVNRQCPQATPFEENGGPKQI